MLYRLGVAYLQAGNERGARSSLQQALKLDPGFKEAPEAKRTLASLGPQ
jgi:Flp pilus assembly protein TadD